MQITSKTHYFIRLDHFDSNYHRKRLGLDHGSLVRNHEIIKENFEFKKEIVFFVTGNTYEFYTNLYSFWTTECIIELLSEVAGLKIHECGHYVIYSIPKTNEKLFQFMLCNLPRNSKVLKKTRGTYYDHGVSRHYRDLVENDPEIKRIRKDYGL